MPLIRRSFQIIQILNFLFSTRILTVRMSCGTNGSMAKSEFLGPDQLCYFITCKVRGWDGYMYEPVWIHPSEAEKRGIKQGDIIGMYNERGMVLGGAYVTERIMPGVAYQDHGARVDPICDDPDVPQSEWIDRGGANNLICPEKILSRNCGGQVGSGFLVEVVKVDINDLKARYPEAFARQYDPGSGLRFSGWVVGGEL